MKSKDIKSRRYPESIAYRLIESGSDNWNKRGSAPLALAITMYQTFGDGLTQHSGDWCPQFGDSMIDVCESFAIAMLEEPDDLIWPELYINWYPFTQQKMAAAMYVGYVEGHPRYYNVEHFGVSRRDHRHDRRWEKVEPWMNGTPASAWSLLFAKETHHDWLVRIHVAYQLKELNLSLGNQDVSIEEIFSPLSKIPGPWAAAFLAYRSAMRMVEERWRIRHFLGISAPKDESEAVA